MIHLLHIFMRHIQMKELNESKSKTGTTFRS